MFIYSSDETKTGLVIWFHSIVNNRNLMEYPNFCCTEFSDWMK